MFKQSLAAAVLGGVLLFAVAAPTPAQAATCQQQVRKAERNLAKAVHRHGRNSRQAEQRREQLEKARSRCRM